MERGEGRRRAPRPRSRKPAGVRWVAGSRGEAGSSPGRCERCGVDPKKCGVCPTTERGAVGGEHPGLPRQSAGGAERGRGQAEVGAGSQRAGNCTGRAFGVPQPHGATVGTQCWGRARRHRDLPARAAEDSGGQLVGKQRGSTPGGDAGTLQGSRDRAGSVPSQTLPPGLSPALQLLAAPLGKGQTRVRL